MKPFLPAAVLALVVACGVQQVELAREQGETILLDPVPQDARDRLQRAEPPKPDAQLTLRYPLDGVALPANVAPITFLFAPDKKAMDMPKGPAKEPAKDGEYLAFELRLSTDDGQLSVLTTKQSATLPLARWQQLLARHVGSDLTVSLRALIAPNRVLQSKSIKLQILAPLRAGVLSYWSDSQLLALVASVDGVPTISDVTSRYPSTLPWEASLEGGRYRASAREGELNVTVDGAALTVPWATAWSLDYPDWAPDASALVLSSAPAAASATGPMMTGMMPRTMPMGMGMTKSSIVRVRLSERTTLSEPEVLVSTDKADESLRAPAYSPAGRSLAFERLKNRDSTGTLWLVPASGGEPEPLAAAHDWKGEGAYPTWLPSQDSRESWLAFSRPLAPADARLLPEQLQLWSVALVQDSDGSWTVAGEPYWLPTQSLEDSNRRLLLLE